MSGGRPWPRRWGTLTEAQNLAHSVMGEVCRVQGHLGHPSGGVLPGQGVVGGSSSIKLCSGEDGRGYERVCKEQLGGGVGGLPRTSPSQVLERLRPEGRVGSEEGKSNKPPQPSA